MKKKLLIINNSPSQRELIKATLSPEYCVLETADALQGLTILSNDPEVKLVLLELTLPKMSGIEFLQLIRSQSTYKNLIVIVVTIYGKPEDETNILGIGADDYICLPFNAEMLLSRIKNVLTNREIFIEAESSFCQQGSILDESNTAIYIVDAVNYNLFYTNKAALQLVNCKNKLYTSKKCYDFFYKSNNPCKFCKLVIAHTDNNKAEIFIPSLNKTVQVHIHMTKWLGRPAYITYLTDTTEQKRARMLADERYQKELQRRCRVDLDFMAYLVFNVTKGTIVEHDPHGFPVPTLLAGQPLAEFSERVLPTVVDFVKRHEFSDMLKLENLQKSYDSGITLLSIDYRRYSRNGKYVMWARSTLQLIKDPQSGDLTGFLYTYDINERKVMQEIINAAVRYDYDMIAYLNLSTKTTKLYAQNDQRFSHFLGREYGYEKVVEEYAKTFIEASEQKSILDKMKVNTIRSKLKETDIYDFIVDVIDLDGVVKKKQFRYANFNKNYGIVLWTEVDITTITEQQKLLMEALLAATNLNVVKTEYLASISQKMRLPFKNITACIKKSIELSEKKIVKDTLDKAIPYLAQLIEITNDIMDISNLENKKMQITNAPFLLSDIIYKLTTKFKYIYTIKKQKFIVEQQIFHDTCFSDAKAITRVLTNILDNAFNYTSREGTIFLKLYELPSEIPNKGSYRFVIKDNGSGIKPELLKNIFTPFYCYVDSNSKSESSGLGLAISKGIVDELGGTIMVNSELGEGTTVIVDLILLLTKTIDEPHEELDRNIVNLNILILEKDPRYILVAHKLLEKKGAKVVVAENYSEALSSLENDSINNFDCILIDLCLPAIEGSNIIAKLKSNYSTTKIPIIGFSEILTDEEKSYYSEAGINFFLKKPLKFPQLFQAIIDLVRPS